MAIPPCLTCGACCAAFRVTFPEAEADDLPGGRVPAEMTVSGPEATRSMRGTLGIHPRCVALEGRVGERVRCGIYEKRPSICMAFGIAWEKNQGNNLCDRARAMYGMTPFSPW